jgi:hypothetical protein
LKQFHTVFHDHYRRYFPAECIFEHYCEEFASYIQNFVTDEKELNLNEVEEDSLSVESFSSSVMQLENFQHCINIEVDGSHTLDTFDITSDVSNSHDYDEFVAQNFIGDLPVFYEYEDDLEVHFSASTHREFYSKQACI